MPAGWSPTSPCSRCNDVFERLEVEFAAAGPRERARPAHRADAAVGVHPTGGCCAACCRTCCPTPSSTRRPARCCSACAAPRRNAHRAGLRHRARHSEEQAHPHLQGVPSSARRLRSSVRGLGLGLSIVERIGKVLGHRDRAAVGAGPRLDVRGRRCRAPKPCRPSPKAARPCPSPGRIAGLTVLCIDNEPAVLDGMRALLEGWGCTRAHWRRAEPRPSSSCASRRRAARHHPGRLPPRRRHRPRSRGGRARRARATQTPGHRHHRGSVGGGAARGARSAATPCCASR